MTLVSFAAAMSLDAMADDPVMSPALAQVHGADVISGLTVLLLLPGIPSFITLDRVETIVSYLPLPASAAFISAGGETTVRGADLTPGAGLLVIAASAAVPLAVAATTLLRRDA